MPSFAPLPATSHVEGLALSHVERGGRGRCRSPLQFPIFAVLCVLSASVVNLLFAVSASAEDPAPPPQPIPHKVPPGMDITPAGPGMKPQPPPPGMGMMGMAQSPEEDSLQQVSKVMYDAAGLELPFRVQNLRFGAERRFVLQVPVGGIDHLEERARGWRMEEMFPLKDEQLKTLTDLRGEYKDELAKLEKQIEETNRASAQKIKDLRAKYEQRANEILTAEARAEKLRLDEAAKAYHKERSARLEAQRQEVETVTDELAKELALAQEQGDWKKIGDANKKLFDKATSKHLDLEPLKQETIPKILASASGAIRAKLDQGFQQFARLHASPMSMEALKAGKFQDMGGPPVPKNMKGPPEEAKTSPNPPSDQPKTPPKAPGDNF